MSFSVMRSGRTRFLLVLLAVIAMVSTACGGGSTTAADAGEAAGSASDTDMNAETVTAIPDPTSTPLPTAIPDPTLTPVPTAAPDPTATPAPIATVAASVDSSDEREIAIADILGNNEMGATRQSAECMVDGVYGIVGTYTPEDDAGLDPDVQNMIIACLFGGLVDDEFLLDPLIEAGYTESEARCIADKTQAAMDVVFATGALDEIALANEMNTCAIPIGPAAGSPAPGLDAELDILWGGCTAGLGMDCAMLGAVADAGSDYQLYAQTCGGQVVAVIDCGLYLNGEAAEDTLLIGDFADSPPAGSPAPGDDPALDALWELCNAEDGAACDDLYYESPVGSVYEAYGYSCGGRSTTETCTSLLDGDDDPFGGSFEPVDLSSIPAPGSPPPGDDPEQDALWERCNAEDAEACNELFYFSPLGSVYGKYGFSCGARAELADCAELFSEG